MVVMENLNKFIRYLKTERNYSDYTIHNYELDITDYLIFSKENGIDIYEPLRDCVQDLNNKIGADATIRLCSSITLEDFATYYSEIGLQSLEEFLDQTTYLLKNGINITEKQSEGLVTDIKNSQPAVEIALNPAKSLG